MADKNINIKIGSSANTSGFNTALGWLNQIRGGIGFLAGTAAFNWLSGAVTSVIEFGRSSVRAFAQAEQGQLRLRSALQVGGDDVARYTKQFNLLAESLQKTTTLDNDVIIAEMAHAKSLGVSASKISEYTKAAVGLSAKLGVDLSNAMQMIIKAGNGSYGAFERMAGGMKFTGTEAEKFKKVMDFANSGIANSKAEIDSLIGSQKQLENTWSDSKEQLGEYIAEILKLREASQMAKDALISVNESPVLKSTFGEGLKGMIKGAIGTVLPAPLKVGLDVTSIGSILGAATSKMQGISLPDLSGLQATDLRGNKLMSTAGLSDPFGTTNPIVLEELRRIREGIETVSEPK